MVFSIIERRRAWNARQPNGDVLGYVHIKCTCYVHHARQSALSPSLHSPFVSLFSFSCFPSSLSSSLLLRILSPFPSSCIWSLPASLESLQSSNTAINRIECTYLWIWDETNVAEYIINGRVTKTKTYLLWFCTYWLSVIYVVFVNKNLPRSSDFVTSIAWNNFFY